MKILLVTFDKEMEQKIRNLLKDYQIVVAKNGEEALLLNVEGDVGLIIYDALAGGIAEEDINRLYDEGFKNVPYIILMDDLFPIDPNNIKPKNKKVISREVEVDKLPDLVKELLEKAPSKEETAESVEEKPTEEPKKEEPAAAAEETSWEEMFGGITTVGPAKEEKTEPAKEEKAEAAVGETPPTAPAAETVSEAKKEEVSTPATPELPLKKKCLLVSFDMPLVERIQQIIGDSCDLAIARSAKQALQKYGNEFFDIIIFDTISGVFAEKGIKDLYEKGGYKDSLYVVLLDEMLPIDVDKLPVKNLRAIKRESELDLLPEIIESAPHISLEKALESAAAAVEEQKPETEEKAAAVAAPPVEEKPAPTPVEEKPPAPPKAEETKPPTEVKETVPAAEEKVQPAQPAEVKPTPAPATVQTVQVQISEEQIAKIVEAKLNEKVIPLIEELIRSKLSEVYVKTLLREMVEEEISESTVREIVREIAEPLVRETLEELLS